MQTALKLAVNSYKNHGFGIVPNFISPSTCQKAIDEVNRLIDKYEPNPSEMLAFNTEHDEYKSSDYYLQSGDKIRFFLEEGSVKDGKITVPKRQAISKLGHGLHEKNKLFHKIAYKQPILEICNLCGVLEPTILQSVVILKQPKTFSSFVVHQDSSFLFDHPQTIMGFWIPLEDATKENGCLWGLKGSHNGKIYCRSFMDWDKKVSVMKEFHQKDYEESDFIPIELEKGSLLFFNGIFLHKSGPNGSDKSRYAYTWHLKEKSTSWPTENWLQRDFPYFEYHDETL